MQELLHFCLIDLVIHLFIWYFFFLLIRRWETNFIKITDYNLFIEFLLIARITKRAQLPFSVWLPLAMVAPTPVSSLVHSSTLVVSGIYLIIRFSDFLFILIDKDIFLCIFILTLMFSSLRAFIENDLKKIIALSTLRQLRLIFVILIIGFIEISLIHLLIHAIFKRLLFLCIGLVIHRFFNEQDIRIMGRILFIYPVLISYINISLLSLCGLPFFSSFFSKEIFINILVIKSYVNVFFIVCIYLSVGFTILYVMRLVYYLNFNYLNFVLVDIKKISLFKVLFILLLFSIILGRILFWSFLKFNFYLLNTYFSILIYLVILMCFIIRIKYIYRYFFVDIYFLKNLLNFNVYKFMYKYEKFIEIGWGECLGGYGIYKNFINLVRQYQYFHMGLFNIYVIMFIFFLMMIIYLNSL